MDSPSGLPPRFARCWLRPSRIASNARHAQLNVIQCFTLLYILESVMRTATTALRLEPTLKHRAEALAAAEQRTFSAVVRDALQMYLGQREAEQAEIREAMASWNEYQQSGQHVTGDEMSAWLRTWGTDHESEPPACHL